MEQFSFYILNVILNSAKICIWIGWIFVWVGYFVFFLILYDRVMMNLLLLSLGYRSIFLCSFDQIFLLIDPILHFVYGYIQSPNFSSCSFTEFSITHIFVCKLIIYLFAWYIYSVLTHLTIIFRLIIDHFSDLLTS